jgi:AcrR family transcriptional regulator/transposase
MTNPAPAPSGRKSEADTVERIVEVAERMFAESGYRGVSLRAVMRECNVHAAAVHYHFGSKEALLEEIFARRAGALNAERLRLLNTLLESQRGAAPSPGLLEDILDAFLRPSFGWPDASHTDADIAARGEEVRRFTRLRSVLAHEEAALSQRLIERHFNETSKRFVAALRGVLPQLSESALFWRFHFLLGAQFYTLSNPGRVESLSGRPFDPSSLQQALDEMIAFIAAGFRAPPPHQAEAGLPGNAHPAAGRGHPAPSPPADALLDDPLWQELAAHLPPPAPRRLNHPGRRPISDREAMEGIVYWLRHQLRWRDLDAVPGMRSGASCWRRLRKWQHDGVWPGVEAVLRSRLPGAESLEFERLTMPDNANPAITPEKP